MNLFAKLMQRWGMLILCLFVGIFGVHKFVEKKIAMGFLYLFTFGLFGFGWLIDCIRYLIQGLSATPNVSSRDESASFDAGLSQSPSVRYYIKTALLWLLIFVLCVTGLASLATGSILAGLALIALAVLLLPINAWQNILSRVMKKTLKGIIAVVLIILFVIGAGTGNTARPNTVGPDISAPAPTTASRTSTLPPTTATKPIISDTTTTTRVTTTVTTTKKPTTTSKTAEIVVVTTTTTTIPTTTTTIHIHTFTDADCISPEICIECGFEQGAPLGHSWQSATCTAPETCAVCGRNNGEALGHSYSDGECVNCGKEDPDYIPEKLVWIPTNGGTKYHRHSSCSQMIDPEQVTESEAIALGFGRCGKCKP